jgi:hypothetical protein
MSLSDAPQARSLTELAETAAAAGDCVSAARHLRNLATLQESDLGSAHPDLANTLNNLAVVSERAGDLDAAETAFRRAAVITRAAFDAGHPFVATTDRNLREFCEAHHRPYERPVPVTASGVESAAAPGALFGRSWSELVVMGLVGGLATAAVLLWLMLGRTVSTPEDAPAPREVAAKPEPKPESIAPSELEAKTAPKPEPPAVTPAPIPSQGASPASLVSATVCRDFSTAGGGEWRCTPVAGSTPVGALVFYTRVKAARPTTIEHRWYRGEALHQRVSLRVAANPGAGYRTFSRNTVGADRTGTWRVELRDAAGAVLHEQTFVVQ